MTDLPAMIVDPITGVVTLPRLRRALALIKDIMPQINDIAGRYDALPTQVVFGADQPTGFAEIAGLTVLYWDWATGVMVLPPTVTVEER